MPIKEVEDRITNILPNLWGGEWIVESRFGRTLYLRDKKNKNTNSPISMTFEGKDEITEIKTPTKRIIDPYGMSDKAIIDYVNT
jgi:hypothetical protein